jgi:VWFA-related protein
MRVRPTAPIAAGLLAASLCGGPAPAQTGGPAEEPSLFVDTLDVNVVNVEVFVTDRDGNRVAGLSVDDFELYEDGEPVEITNFYTVEGGEVGPAGGGGGEPGSAGPPAEPITGEPPVARPAEQQLHLAVYIDNSRLHPGPRRKILEELEGFLEIRLREGDLVMVAESDRSLEIVEPFTRDHSRIVQALSRISRASASGPLAEAEYRRIMRLIPGLLSAPDRTGGIGGEGGTSPGINSAGADHAYEMVKNYAQQQAAEVQRQAKMLRSMVQALAGLPGRKALLVVSGGMEQRPGEALYHYIEDASGRPVLLEAMREDQRRTFNAITREANAHQVTLYTLDGNGAAGLRSISAEHSAEAAGAHSLSGGASLDAIRTQNLQEPLIHLADATGGQSILNTSNYDGALSRAAVDFDAYYSLGYRSPGSGDGKLHRIEVRVQRPGVKVRHRAGYVDKPQSERVADRTLSSLLLAVESNPLGIEIELGQPERRSDRRWLLPVMVRIPFRQLALIPHGDAEEGRINLYLAVQDEHGVSDLHHHLYPVRVPSDQLAEAREQTLGYYAMLEIRPGTPTLAVGVWDELSGVESFVRKEVEAGGEATGRRERGR